MMIIGSIKYVVNGNDYYTWYKIFGDLSSNKRPLVVLHGGPGMSHEYMSCHEEFFKKTGSPVVLYDQIGNGNSSHIQNEPESFWNIDLFMDELDNLLQHLHISTFDLLGHSWGGQLAGYYAATRQPQGLIHLIVANSPASMELCFEGFNDLLRKFPEEQQLMVKSHELNGTMNSKEYKEFVKLFSQKHICTVDPWPQSLQTSFDSISRNSTVHDALLGKYAFSNKGNLANFSIETIAHQIKCPTLLISAPLDEIQPKAVWPWFKNVPKMKWIEFQNSTHLPQFEEPEHYFQILVNFLIEN